MKLRFTKMQGIGNDYIYFDCFTQKVEEPEKLSRALSDRHFGIGGDGIVLICPSDRADAKMRMFNADGSEGKMCGNASRCIGKYLWDTGMVRKSIITLETLSGIKELGITAGEDGLCKSVRVFMGKSELRPEKIPVLLDGDNVIGRTVQVGGGEHRISCVSMGNPHCVIFAESAKWLSLADLAAIGPGFENDPLFPERVNTEFVYQTGKTNLSMRVWERGSGETLACGTGACAAAVAAVENGLCPANTAICVSLTGGKLTVEVTDSGVYMSGPAKKVFDGEIDTSDLGI